MKIVVKIGSNIVAGPEGLDEKQINRIASEISEVFSKGEELVVVSSGAIAAGMKRLSLKKRPSDIRHKQATAAVGQSALMWAYEQAFSKFQIGVAQVLLTRDAFFDRLRYINAKNTLLTLLDYRVIPIINENDTVSVEEIKFGDNDLLASLVAGLLGADHLVILSDVDGLYDKDPRKHSNARLIKTVKEITPELKSLAGGAGSLVGTGGMYSKVLAAEKATGFGIKVSIINGRKRGLLKELLLEGKDAGTTFLPAKKRLTARKGWIAFGSRAKGEIVIDDGAVKALKTMGKSLLPSGIVNVNGQFNAGDAVYCVDERGNRIAKGLTNYSSSEVERIKGLRTSEIEKTLGYKYADEVIHRDNLVLVGA
ncbi:MAG: glutamate 5-kinase [Nitrospirae bacterium]|nr:MAG: glutamate 5-kinase [Nitrospirota bacterium]